MRSPPDYDSQHPHNQGEEGSHFQAKNCGHQYLYPWYLAEHMKQNHIDMPYQEK